MFPENLAISFSVFTLLFIHLRYLVCALLAISYEIFALCFCFDHISYF